MKCGSRKWKKRAKLLQTTPQSVQIRMGEESREKTKFIEMRKNKISNYYEYEI